MKQSNFDIAMLDKHHVRDVFSCGVLALDRYIKEQASQDIKRRISATYVLTENKQKNVIGYYTLSATSVELTELPLNITKKLPGYPMLPATLLGRLAVDKQYQRQNLGELLLMDALKISSDLSKKIGSMAIVVEAESDDAVKFYEKYLFHQFKSKKRCLFLPMSTANTLFA